MLCSQLTQSARWCVIRASRCYSSNNNNNVDLCRFHTAHLAVTVLSLLYLDRTGIIKILWVLFFWINIIDKERDAIVNSILSVDGIVF